MNIKRIGKAIMVLLLATPALSSMELMAQNLKMPTLEDLLPGGATYRIAENLPGLQWWGDVCIKPGIDSLFAVNPKNGKETLLTTREKVNKVLNSLITPTETTATPGHKERLLVLEDGQLVRDGTPEGIYADLDWMRARRLGVPQSRTAAALLKQGGLDIPQDIASYDALLAAVLRAKGGGRP